MYHLCTSALKMAKSSTFVFFLLGILIAQASCVKRSRRKTDNWKNVDPKSNTSATSTQTNADDNVPWILPGFDKTQPPRIDKNSDKKCWQNTNYNVCLTENDYFKMLRWVNKQSNFEVEIEVSVDGDITQDWEFQDTHVHMNLVKDSPPTQIWKFGVPSLKIITYSDGTSTVEWNGDETPEKVTEFKKTIDSWCENNDFFVSKENCVIYDKTNFNNDPAWILTGFDNNIVSRDFNEKGKKCWQDPRYHVCLSERRRERKLYWMNKKSNTKVEIGVKPDSIHQDWQYQGNHVEINQSKDGSVSQKWNLGSSKFVINSDSSDGTIHKEWEGDENPEALKKYQQFIDAWCENNDSFVSKENCLIYNKV